MVGCGGVGGVGWVGGYDQLCCPASPKLLLGLDLGLDCDNRLNCNIIYNGPPKNVDISNYS